MATVYTEFVRACLESLSGSKLSMDVTDLVSAVAGDDGEGALRITCCVAGFHVPDVRVVKGALDVLVALDAQFPALDCFCHSAVDEFLKKVYEAHGADALSAFERFVSDEDLACPVDARALLLLMSNSAVPVGVLLQLSKSILTAQAHFGDDADMGLVFIGLASKSLNAAFVDAVIAIVSRHGSSRTDLCVAGLSYLETMCTGSTETVVVPRVVGAVHTFLALLTLYGSAVPNPSPNVMKVAAASLRLMALCAERDSDCVAVTGGFMAGSALFWADRHTACPEVVVPALTVLHAVIVSFSTQACKLNGGSSLWKSPSPPVPFSAVRVQVGTKPETVQYHRQHVEQLTWVRKSLQLFDWDLMSRVTVRVVNDHFGNPNAVKVAVWVLTLAFRYSGDTEGSVAGLDDVLVRILKGFPDDRELFKAVLDFLGYGAPIPMTQRIAPTFVLSLIRHGRDDEALTTDGLKALLLGSCVHQYSSSRPNGVVEDWGDQCIVWPSYSSLTAFLGLANPSTRWFLLQAVSYSFGGVELDSVHDEARIGAEALACVTAFIAITACIETQPSQSWMYLSFLENVFKMSGDRANPDLPKYLHPAILACLPRVGTEFTLPRTREAEHVRRLNRAFHIFETAVPAMEDDLCSEGAKPHVEKAVTAAWMCIKSRVSVSAAASFLCAMKKQPEVLAFMDVLIDEAPQLVLRLGLGSDSLLECLLRTSRDVWTTRHVDLVTEALSKLPRFDVVKSDVPSSLTCSSLNCEALAILVLNGLAQKPFSKAFRQYVLSDWFLRGVLTVRMWNADTLLLVFTRVLDEFHAEPDVLISAVHRLHALLLFKTDEKFRWRAEWVPCLAPICQRLATLSSQPSIPADLIFLVGRLLRDVCFRKPVATMAGAVGSWCNVVAEQWRVHGVGLNPFVVDNVFGSVWLLTSNVKEVCAATFAGKMKALIPAGKAFMLTNREVARVMLGACESVGVLDIFGPSVANMSTCVEEVLGPIVDTYEADLPIMTKTVQFVKGIVVGVADVGISWPALKLFVDCIDLAAKAWLAAYEECQKTYGFSAIMTLICSNVTQKVTRIQAGVADVLKPVCADVLEAASLFMASASVDKKVFKCVQTEVAVILKRSRKVLMSL